MKKCALLTFRLRVKGEIYDRVYSIQDFEKIIDLFNDINGTYMKIIIEEREVNNNER